LTVVFCRLKGAEWKRLQRKIQPSIFKGVIEMKHLCWSCGIWRTCENVQSGPAKFCDRWKRRTYGEVLKSRGRVHKDFIERVKQF